MLLITKLMMEELKILVLLGLFLPTNSSDTPEVSVSCMMVYDEGGAPAVLESPECPQWVLFSNSLRNQSRNCQFATLQGHREYQEDRVTCDLEMKIRLAHTVCAANNGTKEVMVGIAAVFDGHGGKEASEMASKILLDYFFIHVVFSTYKQALSNKEIHEHRALNHKSFGESLPVIDNQSTCGILKEALLRAIQEIDLKFSVEAFRNQYMSGTTAAVVLLFDGQFLVANIGDSKALLCSKRIHSPSDLPGAALTKLHAEELTRDHHPDREDERARIKAAGGYIRVWGVPRVNGVLALSRAIGDVYLKRYGVIAVPEVTDWRNLTAKDTYLVIASDGVFESLAPNEVCDLLQYSYENSSSSCLLSSSLADCIVNTAFEKGSTDNLSAIVVELSSTGSLQGHVGEENVIMEQF